MNTFIAISFKPVALFKEETHHCVHVLRHHVGDHIRLIDGNGNWAIAEIENAHVNQFAAKIIEQGFEERKDNFLHIAIAPTKNRARFEFFLEKSTELGIDEITPILSFQSERRKVNIDRCQKIIESAVKQSQRLYIPKLNEVQKLSSFLKEDFHDYTAKHICVTTERENHALVKSKKVVALIGPEGGFSNAEIDLVVAKGFKPTGLGKNRLRTETAGVLVASYIN